jgi:hypothetical protein
MLKKLSPLLLSLSLVLADDYTINLKDPVFTNGVLSTEDGGVICNEELRIQAKRIVYTNKVENGQTIKKVEASGDLLLEYKGRVFVGESLEYDLIKKTGVMKNGRTSTAYWFVGGDEIELQEDGSFWISHAFLTTVEGQDSWWELSSSKISISESGLLSAKNIKISFFDFPLFWFPKINMDLKLVKEPPIKYKMIWDQVLKQKISMRYELFSSETFDLFGRLDYRFKKGPGAAIETDYHSLDERTVFQTKNYGAFDKIVPDEKGDKRYRLQGLVTTHSANEKTNLYMSYDKLSDDKMAQDFKSDDFELNTQKRTILKAQHREENHFTEFNFQPKINYFQSINQQLPFVSFDLRPFPLGHSGVIFDNSFSAGYLNYVYSRQLAKELHSSRSGRFETSNRLYRHFGLGPLSLTPSAGFIGIFYSNTPHHHAAGQAMGTYSVDLHTRLMRSFSHLKHILQPYVRLEGITSPTTPNHDHFIFNIQDGYFKQNLFRPGLYQAFYPRTNLLPTTSIDIYTQIFLGSTAFHRALPKLYTTAEFSYPFWNIITDVIYNAQELVWDRANIRSAWTVSQNFAFALEFRHRSKFDWKKSDHDNFILDIARPIDELLRSPISDGRDTLLSRFQIRFSPLWTCHIETHHGWGRRDEPRYDSYEIKLATLLTGRWQLQFGYKYTPQLKEWIFPSIKLLSTDF